MGMDRRVRVFAVEPVRVPSIVTLACPLANSPSMRTVFSSMLRKMKFSTNRPMMITENGIATKNEAKRHAYLSEHIAQVRKAMDEGYDVRGYFVWSLADNYFRAREIQR